MQFECACWSVPGPTRIGSEVSRQNRRPTLSPELLPAADLVLVQHSGSELKMMAVDPFPLFHLSDLSFALDSLPSLSSAQLALASYSSEWDPDANLDKKVSRLFRQRREKIRGRLGTPIGVFASQEDRAATQWPLFELSDLSWELDGANLDHLTSAQLAVRAFSGRESATTLLTPIDSRSSSPSIQTRPRTSLKKQKT